MTVVNDSEPSAVADDESDDLDASDIAELEEPNPNPEPVSYSGSDFDVEGLVRRYVRGDILVPTFGHKDPTIETAGFQRRFVWRRPQMDRFIESLMLGYPIPGIFLVQQSDRRYLVLDGQQRIRTLAAFYEGVHGDHAFSLQNVADKFKGMTYRELSDEQRRTLDNTFIQATIVKTDGSQGSLDAVYQIFERLNAGGTQLTAHEIRVALYAGPCIDFLTDLNTLDAWRTLYGPESPRIRDQELVLRFIAFYISPGTYKSPLKKYLNDFVGQHRYLEALPVDQLRERFSTATRLLLDGPGPPALRTGRQINVALTEAVLVGLVRRLDAGDHIDPSLISGAISQLHSDTDFEDAISRATADEERVRTRFALATRAFAAI